jgi:hypothetical protein
MAASDAKETTMSQQQKDALKDIFRNAPLDIGGDPIEQRTNFEKMLSAQPLADDVTATPGELGCVPVLNIETGESSHDAVMLWFHGGWYVIGSPRTSAGLSSDLSRRVDAKVISVDYRLAPEDPYPAAVQDARAAYRGLLDSGVDPGSIAIVGESAGGGLAVALLNVPPRKRHPDKSADRAQQWATVQPRLRTTLEGYIEQTRLSLRPATMVRVEAVLREFAVGDRGRTRGRCGQESSAGSHRALQASPRAEAIGPWRRAALDHRPGRAARHAPCLPGTTERVGWRGRPGARADVRR